jgi:hypothetical protein
VRDDAPQVGCRCGIYAQPTRTDLDVIHSSPDVLAIIGQVALWGRVVAHERGWRAQYAYPYSLIVASTTTAISRTSLQGHARELQSRYCVETYVD